MLITYYYHVTVKQRNTDYNKFRTIIIIAFLFNFKTFKINTFTPNGERKPIPLL